MKTRLRLLLVFVALGGLLAGCGGSKKTASADKATSTTAVGTTGTTGPASANTGGNARACDLLTPADIDAAVHASVGAGVPRDQGDVTTCTFSTTDKATIVNVFRYERGGDLLKNIRAADPKAKTVTGIGDDAVEQVATGKITAVIGEIGISVDVNPPPSAAALEQLGKASTDHFSAP